MKLEVISNSIKETQLFASKFSKKIKNGTIIALIGDLGSGKTTFTQGFAEGLGINQHIGSPTFKLVSEYTGLKCKLYHADCYRLKNANDFLNFGGENLLIPIDGITIIEWADIIKEILPEHTIIINFYRIKKDLNHRVLKIRNYNEFK